MLVQFALSQWSSACSCMALKMTSSEIQTSICLALLFCYVSNQHSLPFSWSHWSLHCFLWRCLLPNFEYGMIAYTRRLKIEFVHDPSALLWRECIQKSLRSFRYKCVLDLCIFATWLAHKPQRHLATSKHLHWISSRNQFPVYVQKVQLSIFWNPSSRSLLFNLPSPRSSRSNKRNMLNNISKGRSSIHYALQWAANRAVVLFSRDRSNPKLLPMLANRTINGDEHETCAWRKWLSC